jgi:hypothetical protein
MGTLANFLQDTFANQAPPGWKCSTESSVLSKDYEKLIGYSPKADVCLETADASRRIWIEFEVSRADPVANHAKFATAHLFKPFATSDTFVSMVSSHVARGRRNLASNTVHLLRHVGISAFQTPLFPFLPPEEIKRLNHCSAEILSSKKLDVAAELARVFQVVDPLIDSDGHRIHFASELFDVTRNVQGWNAEIKELAHLWGRRTVTYFVFDPVLNLFAPSKFCAYVIPSLPARQDSGGAFGLMNMQTYCQLDETDRRFDGNRARMHLTNGLGMGLITNEQSPEIATAFVSWLHTHSRSILVHPSGAKFLVPPDWYR